MCTLIDQNTTLVSKFRFNQCIKYIRIGYFNYCFCYFTNNVKIMIITEFNRCSSNQHDFIETIDFIIHIISITYYKINDETNKPWYSS